MFIRIKKIKGQDYGYLVQNSWTENGARQKVAKYLGKVHRPQKVYSKGLLEFVEKSAEQYFNEKEFKEIINDITKLELHNHGADDQFFVSEGDLKTISGKSCVIHANNGYITGETIKALHQYNAENDDGYFLANLITSAGLNVEKETFVLLFEKAKAQIQPTNQEFYY